MLKFRMSRQSGEKRRSKDSTRYVVMARIDCESSNTAARNMGLSDLPSANILLAQ